MSSNTPTAEQPSPTNQPQATHGSRKAAIAMMVVFLAPVVIAYIFLKTGIYQDFGTSNRGILLDPPVEVTQMQWTTPDSVAISEEQLQDNWWLVFHLPEQCVAACEQRLLQLRQSVQTLGPEQQRVKPLIVINTNSDLGTLAVWQEHMDQLQNPYLIAQNNQSESFFTDANDIFTQGGLYIVDPMGFAMLYYAPVIDADDAISQAKSFIKDLKYLLKVSRIG